MPFYIKVVLFLTKNKPSQAFFIWVCMAFFTYVYFVCDVSAYYCLQLSVARLLLLVWMEHDPWIFLILLNLAYFSCYKAMCTFLAKERNMLLAPSRLCVADFTHCIPWNPPVFMIFIMESAPPDAKRGIDVAAGQAASASVPSSYFRRWAATSWSSWNVRISHTRTAPSWPPDTIKLGCP